MSPTTPSIRINSGSSLHRYPLPHHHRPSYSSPPEPMAIPRARQDVPPPLPPPRYIGEELRESGVDPGWTWGNNTNYSKDTGFKGNRHGSIRPGSSLLSGVSRDAHLHEHSADQLFAARDSPSDRSVEDADSLSEEDYCGKSRQRPSNPRYVSVFVPPLSRLHETPARQPGLPVSWNHVSRRWRQRACCSAVGV